MARANKPKRPAGRPPLPDNASTLRPLRTRLKVMSIKALPIIEASMNGEMIDGKEPSRDQVATAKWVVTSYTGVHKQIVAEETSVKTEEPTADEPVNVEETKKRLSLVMLDQA